MAGKQASGTGESHREHALCIAVVSSGREALPWVAETVRSLGSCVHIDFSELSRGALVGASFTAVIVESSADFEERLGLVFSQLGHSTPVLAAASAEAPEPPPDPRLFFTLRPAYPLADRLALLRGAIHRRVPATAFASPADAEQMQRILAASGRFLRATSLAEAAGIAERSVHSFVAADRVHCLFHDAETGHLWSETDEQREGYATVGISGFAARTGECVHVERAGLDPRFDRRLDEPAGDPAVHLLVVPIGTPVHAVLIVARSTQFTDTECATLKTLAKYSGPMMHHLALMTEAKSVGRSDQEHLFRTESLDARATRGDYGDVIRVSPGWIRWAYWVLVTLVVACVVFLVVGEVEQYSSGPALIRVHRRTEIAAQSSGPLLAQYVTAGQHVKTGELLMRLDDTSQRLELLRVQREFNALLRKRMLDPTDDSTTQGLISLRGQVRGARDRVEQRQVRAPHDGVVSDLRTRPGQHIEVGDIALSLVHNDEWRRVLALLPGRDRPQIHPGMSLRLELRGYRYAYQDLVIEEVGNEVIGPVEAQRYLGPQVRDSVALAGPVVLVKARLPATSFIADGSNYAYHDGMLGLAEVRIKTEPILELFLPALKRLDGE